MAWAIGGAAVTVWFRHEGSCQATDAQDWIPTVEARSIGFPSKQSPPMMLASWVNVASGLPAGFIPCSIVAQGRARTSSMVSLARLVASDLCLAYAVSASELTRTTV